MAYYSVSDKIDIIFQIVVSSFGIWNSASRCYCSSSGFLYVEPNIPLHVVAVEQMQMQEPDNDLNLQ